MPPLRIVLCDDEPTIRLLLRTILPASEFTVVGEASDGIEAVQVVTALQPDLAVLDLHMPRMDGLEALTRMTHASPGTRVVVFSSEDACDYETEAKARGAVAYMEKGGDVFALLDLLREVGTFAARTRA